MKIMIIKDLYDRNTIWGCVSYDDIVYTVDDIKNEIIYIVEDLKMSNDEHNWQVNDLIERFNKKHGFKDAIFVTKVSCMRI